MVFSLICRPLHIAYASCFIIQSAVVRKKFIKILIRLSHLSFMGLFWPAKSK